MPKALGIRWTDSAEDHGHPLCRRTRDPLGRGSRPRDRPSPDAVGPRVRVARRDGAARRRDRRTRRTLRAGVGRRPALRRPLGRRLREQAAKQVRDRDPDRRFIHTHPGFGYRFQPEPSREAPAAAIAGASSTDDSSDSTPPRNWRSQIFTSRSQAIERTRSVGRIEPVEARWRFSRRTSQQEEKK